MGTSSVLIAFCEKYNHYFDHITFAFIFSQAEAEPCGSVTFVALSYSTVSVNLPDYQLGRNSRIAHI